MDWLDLLHVADSSFPTGAYAHSAGLETLAPANADALERLLNIRVRETLGRLELVFLLHAFTEPLADLDRDLHARLLARETRDASASIGTSLLQAACELTSDARVAGFLERGPHRHHPIAFGAVARALGEAPDLAASTYAFQSIRGSVSAAQRLGRLGQRDAQRVLQRLKPAIHAAVTEAATLQLADAGAFAPEWDLASMRHEYARTRMFAS